MAETRDIAVDTTQHRNSASMIDRGIEDNIIVGVADTVTTHIADTSDFRKHPGGSSPVKVRVHLKLKFGFTFESLRIFPNGRTAQTLKFVFTCGMTRFKLDGTGRKAGKVGRS
jgi:hypothetical protein